MATSREAPRLSAAIDCRLHNGKSLQMTTLEDQIVSRRLALRDSLARSFSAGSHGQLPGSLPLVRSMSTSSASARAAVGRLDWPSFAGPFTSSGDGHVRTIKTLYQRFIAQVAVVVGDAAPDAVQTAAFEIYMELNKAHSTFDSSSSILRTLLGSQVSLEVFINLKALVSQLNTWRQKHNVKPDITHQLSAIGAATDFRPLFSHSSSTAMVPDMLRIQGAPIVAELTPLQVIAQTHEFRRINADISAPIPEAGGLHKAGRSTRPSAAVVIDGFWMLAQCTQFLREYPNDAFTPETLATALLDLFQHLRARSADADARLQSGLFEMLGDSGFELMQMLLEHRGAIALVTVQGIRKAAATLAAQMLGLPPAQSRLQPALGPGVVVSTTSDIRAAKDLQKLGRKVARQQKNIAALHERIAEDDEIHGVGSSDLNIFRDSEERSFEATAGRGTGARGASKRGTLSVDAAIAAVGAGYGGVQKTLLPEGTVETAHDGYKEVLVPPSKPPSAAMLAPLVAISDLHPLAQQAFKGIQKLNRLQSELFDAAYSSNENLLVCAPTGAGKTNVAMLTICHQLLQHLTSDMRIHVDNFKVIYVAPMKALAQEIVAKFSQRLEPIGLRVREFTGDTQLTKREISETQVIVTTPEKWDVITRKAGDGSLVSLVKLLIIDEVHLLADDRGAVIESIVARTLRLVESSQSAIRIVGLSATLPNYQDVALFLRVNPARGLFYFNDAYRPVPLQQRFIGVTEMNSLRRVNVMNKIAFDRSMNAIRRAKQVMVFVHSRKDTAKTAQSFAELARADDSLRILSPFSEESVENVEGAPAAARVSAAIQGEGRVSLNAKEWITMQKDVEKSRNKELQDLFKLGFGIHHAGMLRSDRALTERMFAAGVIKILVCTATLAWGVNLPAHTVIIKGTQLYNAESGGFTDLGMLDVLQIFGRAGRPQFDTSGEGIIITSHDKLHHYLRMLVQSVAIESSFIKSLADHLNAEIVSGTVTNMREAVSWLSYTYLFIRMLRNPISYGVSWEEHKRDPMLELKRVELISQAAKRLDACHMSRFDEVSGNLAVTDLGRVASHYYICNESIETFNGIMDSVPTLTDADMLSLVCKAHEFKNIKVREEELTELDSMKISAHFPIKGDINSTTAKVNVLLQSYISQHSLHGFTLVSDMAYINQSAGRISRALFEIFLRKGWCSLAERLLTLCKSIDKRQWWDANPLWQLCGAVLNAEEVKKLAESNLTLDALCELEATELGAIVRHPRNGPRIANALRQIPYLHVEPSIQPITRGILRVSLKIFPDFTWNDRLHFTGEPFYVWIEDAENEHIYHHEYLTIYRKQLSASEPISLVFAIPIFEPLPSQYWVRVLSDRWLGVDTAVPISFKHLILPERHPPHTDLLDLVPVPVSALKHAGYESMYGAFSHFNPVQTQFFHVAYHTDHNVLLGAPTGSGKTVLAELAIFRLWEAHAGMKAVYIAPLKALVSERLKDWRKKFSPLRRSVVELTGDFTPDLRALKEADVIISTPEKWDSISRAWQRREYVKAVGAVIIDEIHLLGEDRGPVLEVIVSRMRYISSQTDQPIRFIGLSTALANARDLGDWLGIEQVGLYNFRPSVRPIPMEVHIQGFPGKHYCPRMATMNKPTYAAITSYSPSKPALVFVSSRRQTRLTALDLIALCAADEDPRRFLHLPEADLLPLLDRVQDSALRHTLAFGVGIHHAGLPESDRSIVEELYCKARIQVLVCTSTLAWGVNFPAHLVVVKGTEFFDAKTSRYVDYPITDVLQMMGRAGRPQFDSHAVAVILVHEPKKNFYRKFLYEPFPVESQLKSHLIGHLNAEIVGGTITCRKDAIEYLTWTYFFRRLLQNPGYYGLEDASNEGVKAFLFQLVDEAFGTLHESGCVLLGEAAVEALLANTEDHSLRAMLPDQAEAVFPSSLGRIASSYYLHHATVLFYSKGLREAFSFAELLELICNGPEFAELPVRHNEDQLNDGLSLLLPWRPRVRDFASPHVKAFLLLQARFMHAPLPITDYITDTKSVLDQAIRVFHAAMDIAADGGLLLQTLRLAQLTQCVVMAVMPAQDPLWQLRGMNETTIIGLHGHQVPELMCMRDDELTALLVDCAAPLRQPILGHIRRIPDMSVALNVTSAVSAVERSRLHGQPTEVVVGAPVVHLTVTTEATNQVQAAAVTPFYAKQKEWSWWIVIGDKERKTLLGLKQVIGCRKSTNEFSLDIGKSPEVTVYLLSDTMRGIDQEYTVRFAMH